jgi:hypothetical protein
MHLGNLSRMALVAAVIAVTARLEAGDDPVVVIETSMGK